MTYTKWKIQNKTDIDNLYSIYIITAENIINIEPKILYSNMFYEDFCKFIYLTSSK